MSDDSDDHGFSLFQQGASTDWNATSSTGKRKTSVTSSRTSSEGPSEKKKKFKPSLEKAKSVNSLAVKRKGSTKSDRGSFQKDPEVIDIEDDNASDEKEEPKPKPKPKPKKAKQQELGLNLELRAPKDTQAENEEMAERCDRILKHSFGYASYKGKQKEIVEAAVQGKDVFVLAPTGMGKSLCFQIPALAAKSGVTLVVSPLLSLIQNQIDNLREKGVVAAALNSKTEKKEKADIEEDLASANPSTQILYVTPERLKTKEFQILLDTLEMNGKLNRLVVDEAHCISEWGHDFRGDYRRLGKFRENYPNVPIMALTATATETVQRDIIRNLRLNEDNLFRALHPFNRENLFYEVKYLSDNDDLTKMKDIHDWIMKIYHRRGKKCSGIIYVRNRKGCDSLTSYLRGKGINAGAYHAGVNAKSLENTLGRWMNDDGIDVVVATVAFGMGIDKADVRYVIHYDLPKSFEGYYQETGRAGRDGLAAKCIMYFSREDCVGLKKLVMMPKDRPFKEEYEGPPPTQQASDSLDSLFNMGENPKLCRHVAICRYFGEVIDPSDKENLKSYCNNMCDVCKFPDKTLQSYMKLSPIDVKAACAHLSASSSSISNPNPLRSSSSINNTTFTRGSVLGMGAGLKRPLSKPEGRMDAGKEAFKKMKVDLAPVLVTKPFKSVGGLKKPFKLPTFNGASGSGRGEEEDGDDEVEVVESAPVSRRRVEKVPLPEPVHDEEEKDVMPVPKPVALLKRKGKERESIEVDDDDAPNRRRKASSPQSASHSTLRLDDDDSDVELPPAPSFNGALSSDIGRIWDDEEMDVAMDDDGNPTSSGAQDWNVVTLLHDHSTKVPEATRREGYEVLRKALFKLFISGEGSGRLWGRLKKAPASSDRRKRILSSTALQLEGSALIHSSTVKGYGFAISSAETAIKDELGKVDLWNSGDGDFEEAQEVLDIIVQECSAPARRLESGAFHPKRTSNAPSTRTSTMSLRYITARLAQQIDEELMSAAGAFSLDQLMELAGLACAQTLATCYSKTTYPRVLVCCGPGNQGGDGLVAARHLGMFGYRPTVYMPKPGTKDIYKRLAKQCENMDIPILEPSNEVDDLKATLKQTDVILDAIFGFSFKPPIRAPFDKVLPLLSESRLPIVSVDIPSGWDVEKGNKAGIGLNPDVLLSLTAPKEGVKDFTGRHFLGGRFVPKNSQKKFELNLPEYPGVEQIVELPSLAKGSYEQ